MKIRFVGWRLKKVMNWQARKNGDSTLCFCNFCRAPNVPIYQQIEAMKKYLEKNTT